MRLLLLRVALISVLAGAGGAGWCEMADSASRSDNTSQRAVVIVHTDAGVAPCDMGMPANVVDRPARSITAVRMALAAISSRTSMETPRCVGTELLSVLRAHSPDTQRLLASISLQV